MGKIAEELKKRCGKEISLCDNRELYYGLLALVQEEAGKREISDGKKKVIIFRQSF